MIHVSNFVTLYTEWQVASEASKASESIIVYLCKRNLMTLSVRSFVVAIAGGLILVETAGALSSFHNQIKLKRCYLKWRISADYPFKNT